jgi:hypothetical protein
MSSELRALATIERLGYVLAGAFTILAGLLWGRAAMWSAGVGGALAAANIYVMRRLVERAQRAAAQGRGETAMRWLLAALVLKMPVLFGLVYLAVVVLGLDAAPFALGLSALVLALIAGGLYAGLSER